MKIIFVTQVIDPGDPTLGFVCRSVTALAERFDGVDVIANRVQGTAPDLGESVRVFSMGKERGFGRLRRGVEYQRLLMGLARSKRPKALLTHMCPVYLTMAAPIATAFGIRTILWFAHPGRSASLRVAAALADRVVTSLPGAYPYADPKVRVIGQAIDTRSLAFSPPEPQPGSLRLVAVGRTSPVKGFDVIVRAVNIARQKGVDVRLRIVGPASTPQEEGHRGDLRNLIADLGLGEAVTLEPAVPPSEIPDVIRWGKALVNATVAGSGDKVVLEAMAVGRPVIFSNEAFLPLTSGLPVRLSFRQGDVEDLAERMCAIAGIGAAETARVVATLRERVDRDHSVEHWAESVFDVAAELQGLGVGSAR